MRSRNIDPTLPRFVEIGTRFEEFTVISKIHRLITHWDTSEHRTRICGGPVCELCQTGHQKLARFYMMLVDGGGRDKLLELRARHMDILDAYDEHAGLVIKLRKEGTAKNSPVTLVVTGEREVVERDIARLVARFCLPAKKGETTIEARRAVDQLLEQVAPPAEVFGRDVPNPPGYEDFE